MLTKFLARADSMADNLASSSSTDGGCEENLIESLLSQVDDENIAAIIRLQKNSLLRFEKTNEMLSNCIMLSTKRLEKARKDLIENKQLLLEMKSDLDSVFRRIRIFRQHYISKYTEIYKHFEEKHRLASEEE